MRKARPKLEVRRDTIRALIGAELGLVQGGGPPVRRAEDSNASCTTDALPRPLGATTRG